MQRAPGTLIHLERSREYLLCSDYWAKRIYAHLRGAMGQAVVERAVIDKRRPDSILSGHGYRVQQRSRFL